MERNKRGVIPQWLLKESCQGFNLTLQRFCQEIWDLIHIHAIARTLTHICMSQKQRQAESKRVKKNFLNINPIPKPSKRPKYCFVALRTGGRSGISIGPWRRLCETFLKKSIPSVLGKEDL